MQVLALKNSKSLLKELGLILSFTFLMVLASFVRIPLFFSPVPITFQTFIIFLSLVFLGRKAYVSQFFYLGLGALGLPIFASGGAGLLYLLGPTGGYLFGFLISTLIFGNFLKTNKSFSFILATFLLVSFVIYSCGIVWLMVGYRFSLSSALYSGVIPFLGVEAFKIALASLISFNILKRC